MINQTTETYLLAYWLFSSICASMPELSSKANFFLVWLHNAVQWIAANPYKTFKINPISPEKPAL